MGVVTNITMTTTRASGLAAGTYHEESDDIVEVGSMVIESLLVMDFDEVGLKYSYQKQIPFKVSARLY